MPGFLTIFVLAASALPTSFASVLFATSRAWDEVVMATMPSHATYVTTEPVLELHELQSHFDSVWDRLRTLCPTLPHNGKDYVSVGFDDALLQPSHPELSRVLGGEPHRTVEPRHVERCTRHRGQCRFGAESWAHASRNLESGSVAAWRLVQRRRTDVQTSFSTRGRVAARIVAPAGRFLQCQRNGRRQSGGGIGVSRHVFSRGFRQRNRGR